MNDQGYANFDPEKLHALGDDELDALPFGVIALGPEGVIARYNLAEARFARLDRAQVVGRSFYKEIARCTATPEFKGRYEAISTAKAPTKARFEYTFAFRFGAQNVEVDMGSVAGTPLVYICVNRRKFLPRQRDVSPSIEAPLIAELEPEAERAGVFRDARARRNVELDATFVVAMLGALGRPDREGPVETLRAIGTRWGRYAVVDLETEALEGDARTLAELSMARAMEVLARFIQRQRIGRVTFDYADAERGFFSLGVERNVFAEALTTPGCAILEALFSVVFSHLAGRPVIARETSCRASGAETCAFICLSASRADALTRALDRGNRSPREVAEAIANEARDG